jgi:hypothetical protein
MSLKGSSWPIILRFTKKKSVGIIFTCKSHDLMSCDSASANRVAEEVYPSFESIIYLLNANCIPRELMCHAMRSR